MPRPAERFVEGDLAWGRGEQVLAAQHVGDPHQRVVDRVHQRVERVTVGAHDREVGDVLGLEGDLAADQVVEDDRAVGDPDAHDVGASLRLEGQALLGGEAAAVAVVPLDLGAGGLAARLDLLVGAEAVVRRSGLAQLRDDVAVDVEPLGLLVGAELAAHAGALVVVDAEPGQRVDDRGVALGGVAREVGVLDAQHQRAAVVARERPVEQGRPHVADVQVACRRGWEPDADRLGGELAQHRVCGLLSHVQPPCSSGCRCPGWRPRPRHRAPSDRHLPGCR